MNGVSKITSAEDIVLIRFPECGGDTMTRILGQFAESGVVVDMICQTPPSGGKIRFSFTTTQHFFDAALKAIGTGKPDGETAPMISAGYAKINLFGEEMVDSVGVAARAMAALGNAGLEIFMITTSDLDISILVRQEDEDVALAALNATYGL